jgi:SAM-dependent methyltransferase
MSGSPSWNDLFLDPRFHWTEPDPGVVSVAPRWREEGRRVVYDLGCGAGRHMAYLQAEGFEAVGSDVAPNGLSVCRAQLAAAGLPAKVVRADMTACPFADATFDAAVSTNVLNHNPRALLQRALDELHRVLKPGGEAYLTVLSTDDWRCGSGEEVEPNSFVLAEGPEAGILHHFFDEADLRDWVRGFTLLDLQRIRGSSTSSVRAGGDPVEKDAWAVWLRVPPAHCHRSSSSNHTRPVPPAASR